MLTNKRVHEFLDSGLILSVNKYVKYNILSDIKKSLDYIFELLNNPEGNINLNEEDFEKLNLFLAIVDERLKNFDSDIISILNSVLMSDTFSNLYDKFKYLYQFIDKDIYEIENEFRIVQSIVKDIYTIKTIIDWKKTLIDIELDDNFSWKKAVKTIVEEGSRFFRNINLITHEEHKSLEISSDNIDLLDDLLLDRISLNNIIVPTDFPGINKALKGGYQSGRVYIWAGPAGQGKSTILLNSVYSAMKYYKETIKEVFKSLYPEKNPVVYYFTNENTIQETFERLATIITDNPIFIDHPEYFRSDETKDIAKKALEKLKNEIKNFEVNVKIEYISPHKSTPFDIMSKVQSDPINRPFIIIIDYLDRLNSSIKAESERLRLGYVVDELKDISIELNIPVVTATQLNRESLKTNSLTADITNVSESWKKVENADVVFLFKTIFDSMMQEYVSHVSIGKHRYYKSMDPNNVYKLVQKANSSYRMRERINNDKVDNQTITSNDVFDLF